jgi:hypothetical protein
MHSKLTFTITIDVHDQGLTVRPAAPRKRDIAKKATNLKVAKEALAEATTLNVGGAAVVFKELAPIITPWHHLEYQAFVSHLHSNYSPACV